MAAGGGVRVVRRGGGEGREARERGGGGDGDRWGGEGGLRNARASPECNLIAPGGKHSAARALLCKIPKGDYNRQ